jgi:hypothetical protein
MHSLHRLALACTATAILLAASCVAAITSQTPPNGTYVCRYPGRDGSQAKSAGTLTIHAARYQRRAADNTLIENGTVSVMGPLSDAAGTELAFTGRATTSMRSTENGKHLRMLPTLEATLPLDCTRIR